MRVAFQSYLCPCPLAVLPSSCCCVSPFREATAFRHRPAEYVAHCNGKSFGRLSAPSLRANGPHHFRAADCSKHSIPPSVAVVLHYESVTFEQWKLKYTDLAARHGDADEVLDQIASRYYRESIRVVSAGLRARAQCDGFAQAEAEARAFALWQEYKLAPPQLPPATDRPLILRSRGITILNPFADEGIYSANPAMTSADLWARVGLPLELSISNSSDIVPEAVGAGAPRVGVQADETARLRDRMQRVGCVRLDGWVNSIDGEGLRLRRYGRAIDQLEEAGLPPAFLLLFDEVWKTIGNLSRSVGKTFDLSLAYEVIVMRGDFGDAASQPCTGIEDLAQPTHAEADDELPTTAAVCVVLPSVHSVGCVSVISATGSLERDCFRVLKGASKAPQCAGGIPLHRRRLGWSQRSLARRSLGCGSSQTLSAIAFAMIDTTTDKSMLRRVPLRGTLPLFGARLALVAVNALANIHTTLLPRRLISTVLTIVLRQGEELSDAALSWGRRIGTAIQRNLAVIHAELTSACNGCAGNEQEQCQQLVGLLVAVAGYIVRGRGLAASDALKSMACLSEGCESAMHEAQSASLAPGKYGHVGFLYSPDGSNLQRDFEVGLAGDDIFRHEGEVLVGSTTAEEASGSPSLLTRRTTLGGFRLWFMAKVDGAANGGLQLLSKLDGSGHVCGPQVRIGERDAGRLWSEAWGDEWIGESTQADAWRAGEWNLFEVEVRPLMRPLGYHVRVRVNEQLMSDERVDVPWTELRIGFAVVGRRPPGASASVHFRDVRISEPQLSMAHLPHYGGLSASGEAPALFASDEGRVGARSFDFIVVGGGGAGCAAAYTLANEFPTRKVLLIEAGERSSLYGTTAAAAKRSVGVFPFKKTVSRLLGGGTRQNGQAWRSVPDWYVRAHMYDETNELFWCYASARVWADHAFSSPREVVGCTEAGRGPPADPRDLDAVEVHAGYGTVSFQDPAGQTGSADAVLPEMPSSEPRYSFTTLSQDLSGRRTSGQTLIESFEGDNLTVLTSAHVDRILFRTGSAGADAGGTASGVQLASGTVIGLTAGGELVLAANVYETPTLLQRSGVGPAAVLARNGVKRLAAVPHEVAEHVGRNFWSNLYLSRLDYRRPFLQAPTPAFVPPGRSRVHQIFQAQRGGTLHSLRADIARDSLDLEDGTCMAGGTVEESGEPFNPSVKYSWELPQCARVAAAVFVTSLEVYSKRIQALEFAFHGDGDQIVNPPPSDWAADPRVIDAMLAILNRGVPDSIHNGGTCSMGSVVDSATFKLRGLSNVRVADLSVYPSNLPGNTMAAAFTIGRFVARCPASPAFANPFPLSPHPRLQTFSQAYLLSYAAFITYHVASPDTSSLATLLR